MVRRPGRSGQVWSMEKLDNKLVDMRDMYDDWRRRQACAGDDDTEEVTKLVQYCGYRDLYQKMLSMSYGLTSAHIEVYTGLWGCYFRLL